MSTTNGPTWRYDTASTDGGQVLRLAGELDMDATAALRDLLDGAVARSAAVEVDLTEVRFIDSTVITTLVAAHNAAARRACRLTVTNPQGHVRRVLELTGVLRTLT